MEMSCLISLSFNVKNVNDPSVNELLYVANSHRKCLSSPAAPRPKPLCLALHQ